MKLKVSYGLALVVLGIAVMLLPLSAHTFFGYDFPDYRLAAATNLIGFVLTQLGVLDVIVATPKENGD